MAKLSDLLSELDTAFDAAESSASDAAAIRVDAAAMMAQAKAEYESVQDAQAKRVEDADKIFEDDRARLTKLRDQVNVRVGSQTSVDPRVTVK